MLAIPLVFDLDGTLFDNENIVWQCYQRAGAEPPKDFWGQTAAEWLNDPEVHMRKNEYYFQEIPYLRPTPFLKLFYRHGGTILTGASLAAAKAICETWLLRPSHLFCEQTTQDKIDYLIESEEPGLYLEDLEHVAKRVEEETLWQVMQPSSSRLLA